jgi:hypothetical protein
LYQDNIVVRTVTGLNLPNLNNSANLIIGGRHPNFSFNAFDGDIDEVEFFKRALTASELNSIFSSGPSGKCKE